MVRGRGRGEGRIDLTSGGGMKIFFWGGGSLGIWNFQRYQRNSMWNFPGLVKNEMEFPRVIKKKIYTVEFPGILVFGLNFRAIQRKKPSK